MHTSDLTPDLLSRLHRLATLLTGSPAAGAQLLGSILQRCDGQMDQFRRERQGLAMLVARLREMAAKTPSAPVEAGASTSGEFALARAFSQIPEPRRSALALLYTGLFPLPEIASLLGLSIDELCETFSAARTALDASWLQRDLIAPLPSREEEFETEAPRA